LLLQTFRPRTTYAEVLAARKKKMASRWTYSYTHYNRHKGDGRDSEKKRGKSNEESQRPVIEGVRKSTRMRRKITPEDLDV